ncbi:MAG: HDOD domain-containing protein [candidate division Zixibacteria bacterium]
MGTLTTDDSIARRIKEMPMLSAVASRLLELTGDQDHSINDVGRIVESDAFLTSRVLRVANSAAFSPIDPIQTVNKAVSYLGEKMLIGIAIGSGSAKVFKTPLDGYESKAGELWDHSLRTAIASRELAEFAAKNLSPNIAFTAGLLHDIGKSVISEFLEGNTKDLTSLCDKGVAEDFLAAERSMAGTDHCEVGFQLGNHWRLPATLCAAIKYHHHPWKSEEEYKPLVYAVHLGDIVAMLGGVGTGADSFAYRIDINYDNYIKVGKEDLSYLLLKVEEEFSKTRNFVFGSEEI